MQIALTMVHPILIKGGGPPGMGLPALMWASQLLCALKRDMDSQWPLSGFSLAEDTQRRFGHSLTLRLSTGRVLEAPRTREVRMGD